MQPQISQVSLSANKEKCNHRVMSATAFNAEVINCKQRWVEPQNIECNECNSEVTRCAQRDKYSHRLLSATTSKIIDCKTEECNHIILLSGTTARTATGYNAPSTQCYWLGRAVITAVWLSALRTPRNRRNSMRRHSMEKEELSSSSPTKKDASRSEKKGLVSSFDVTLRDFDTHPNWNTIGF